MPESTVVRTKRDTIIEITDGTNTYTIQQEVGDFNWDAPLQTVNHFSDRGEIRATPDLRDGDDQPMTLGWSMYMRDLGDTASPKTYQSALDLLLQLASGYTAVNWTSTLGTHSETKTWTVKQTVDGGAFGEADKTYTFPFVVLRASGAEGDPNTITITGTSYALRPTLS